MELYERIKEAAARKKISIARLERETGLSNGSVSKWSKNAPSADKVAAVAKYLNVSTDYLLEQAAPTDDQHEQKAKQLIMRADTDGLTVNEIKDLEQEMERFFEWRLNEIKREKEQSGE